MISTNKKNKTSSKAMKKVIQKIHMNKPNKNPNTAVSKNTLDRLVKRALYYSTQMIHIANNRSDAQKGDPKVGGHQAACASCAHILGSLHLLVRESQDHMAVKPHASPMDHSYGHLLELFYKPDGAQFTEEEAKKVMHRLRDFMDPNDPNHEPAFQSYHAAWDPDSFNFFPSGSVGIPPVVSAYTALAYRFANDHGFKVPANAHFWSMMGDSEFREGSLMEAMPDIAERGLNNVTWIVDYNRQNLDGTRILNEEGLQGTDADRIERTARANGWEAIQVRHGKIRQELFKKPGGDLLRTVIEKLSDFEIQAMLVKKDGKLIKQRLLELDKKLSQVLGNLTDQKIWEMFFDFGGHDIEVLAETFQYCRKASRPTLVVAHTIKGWGLRSQAMTGNHSMLADEDEVVELRKKEGVAENDLFERFDSKTEEAAYCSKRGEQLRKGIEAQRKIKEENSTQWLAPFTASDSALPSAFNINLKLSPWANTQWMWGQLAAKLVRIANSAEKDLNDDDKAWSKAARFLATMAPDVGTSTNLNPGMDGKVYAPNTMEDFESIYNVKDKRRPDLVPLEKQANRHLRFEIEEANAMSCVGAFGKMIDHLGIPILPFMTVYDFFIKRALDQYFYNLYWNSSFVLVGTPSGVTLSPEGAQHSWKSDIQIPNGITWEPAFAIEMDWILTDAIERHFTRNNKGRQGVLLRAVTRGLEQKQMLDSLKKQKRFEGSDDASILAQTRADVLNGGYWLLNYEGYEGYVPGDNVVNLFVMGALAPEAISASEKLLAEGIYANIVLVSSPDLLIGSLARENNYTHLKTGLGVSGHLHLVPANNQGTVSNTAELLSLRASRVPIIAICDGEAGLLDNIGSIIGVPQDTLAVRKHSKCGTPEAVYKYHHMDPDSIVESVHQIFEEMAKEELKIALNVLQKALG